VTEGTRRAFTAVDLAAAGFIAVVVAMFTVPLVWIVPSSRRTS
jgi:hypothetical protein